MDELQELRVVLANSTDEANPPAEELRALLGRVQRIGVIGLSRFPEKAARRVPSYLAAKGYEIVPINPSADRILGQRAYDTLADVPGALDMVIVFRPSEEAGAHVREVLERPERPAIWLQEGIVAEEEVAEARAAGVTAVQDLCAFKVHRALYG